MFVPYALVNKLHSSSLLNNAASFELAVAF